MNRKAHCTEFLSWTNLKLYSSGLLITV